MNNNTMTMLRGQAEKWKIKLLDTGQDTMTGGRLKRIGEHLDDDDFCMTYGEAVSTLNVGKTIAFLRSHGKLATVTAMWPLAGPVRSTSITGRFTDFARSRLARTGG
jgi:glucose-1-phosphate cytidylyltransferase